jgi:hypothetical protein
MSAAATVPWRDAMELTDAEQELQERAKRFVDEILIPHEVEAELAGGKVSAELRAKIRSAAIAARLGGGMHRNGVEWTVRLRRTAPPSSGRAPPRPHPAARSPSSAGSPTPPATIASRPRPRARPARCARPA